MSLDAINRVTTAEGEAEAIRADFAAQAKKLLADTEAAGRDFREKRRAEAEEQNAKKLADAEREAQAGCDAILAKADEESKALKTRAESRMKDARRLIVGRIVNG